MGLSRSKPVPQPSAVVKDYQWDALPKHSYHQLPETEFDDFPIADDAGAASVAAAYRITSDDLRALYTLDERAHSVSKALLESIQRSRYAVLVLGDDDMHLVREGFRIAKAFLELPTERKAEVALPHHESGRRNRFSGYSQLRFDNCTARRDPEERDVLQLRLSEEKDIAWPDEEFERIARALYQSQFDLSTAMLRALALAVNAPIDSFVSKAHPADQECSPLTSENTNLCFFRYYDYNMSYKQTQRCMVHQDGGLVTLLPRATAPGVEIFDCENRVWLQPERFLEENECLVYFGDALNHMTRGCVPAAIHRVVREPQTERFSMPFEMKPISSAIMAVDAEFPAVTEPSKLMRVGGPGRCFLTEPPEYDAIPFSQLEIRKTWERVERSVARADAHAEAQLHLQQQMKELDESDHNGPDLYESTGTDMDA